MRLGVGKFRSMAEAKKTFPWAKKVSSLGTSMFIAHDAANFQAFQRDLMRELIAHFNREEAQQKKEMAKRKAWEKKHGPSLIRMSAPRRRGGRMSADFNVQERRGQ